MLTFSCKNDIKHMVTICWIMVDYRQEVHMNLGLLQERSGWQRTSAWRRSGASIPPPRRSPPSQGRSWACWGPLVDTSTQVTFPWLSHEEHLGWTGARTGALMGKLSRLGNIERPHSSLTTAESFRKQLTLFHRVTFKFLIFLPQFKTFCPHIWNFM